MVAIKWKRWVSGISLLVILVLSIFLFINKENSVADHYDVIVIGSDPEGIAAAVAASRENQTTLLVDTRSKAGGLFTLGELNSLDMSYLPGSKQYFNKGLFEEFFNGIGRRTSFDIDQVQEVLDKMLEGEPNLTLELSAEHIEPVLSGREIAAVKYINSKGNVKEITGKQFIDATQDADFAAEAGVSFTVGQEDYRGTDETMCVTLVFEVSGADWEEIVKYLRDDKDSFTGTDAYSAWGYAEMYNYESSDPDVRMRGLNIGRKDNGNLLINALQILNVDGTDEAELESARKKAEKELPMVIEEMRNLPGFAEAELAGIAPEMYVRETRHMEGVYRLTIDDVLENRDFPDKIAFGSYPVDVQKSNSSPDMIVGNPEQFSIPFRSIVPKEFDNLLVASRSASYDSLAHGSARVVPVGMNVAEAAGVAAAYANQSRVSFADIAADEEFIHIKQIQDTLNQNNAQLSDIPDYDVPVMKSWAYEGIKFLRKYAIISSGYNNDYALEETISKQDFVRKLDQANVLSGVNKEIVWTFGEHEEESVTKAEVLHFMQKNNVSLDAFSQALREHLEQEEESLLNETAYQLFLEFLEQ